MQEETKETGAGLIILRFTLNSISAKGIFSYQRVKLTGLIYDVSCDNECLYGVIYINNVPQIGFLRKLCFILVLMWFFAKY